MEKKEQEQVKSLLTEMFKLGQRAGKKGSISEYLQDISDYSKYILDIFYSDPPLPEMVCPTCKGTGSVEPYDDDIRKCPDCNGTGKVPAPVPPEKVWDLLLTDEEIRKASHIEMFTASGHMDWTKGWLTIRQQVCQAQILKLQQAGWGNVAEARQQAIRQMFDEMICPLCYRLNPQHASMDYGKGCHTCKEKEDYLGELPKE